MIDLEGCVFPRTVVITTGSEDEVWLLMNFLKDAGFHWSSGAPLPEDGCLKWGDDWGGDCFNIDTDNKVVYQSSRRCYEEAFENDCPELMPDDEQWFLCSVGEFIAMCKGMEPAPEFEAADEGELNSFLFL